MLKEDRKKIRDHLILRTSVLAVLQQSLRNRARRRFALFLASIVVFTTTYAMILPALSLENNTVRKLAGMNISAAKAELLDCHVDIHQHTDDCYR